MATSKSTTVGAVSTNSAAIDWPVDIHGFTSLLRKEGVRAVGRIKNDDEKLQLFLRTLHILAGHAKAKHAAAKAEMAAAVKKSQDRAALEAAEAEKMRLAQVQRMRAQLEQLEHMGETVKLGSDPEPEQPETPAKTE